MDTSVHSFYLRGLDFRAIAGLLLVLSDLSMSHLRSPTLRSLCKFIALSRP